MTADERLLVAGLEDHSQRALASQHHVLVAVVLYDVVLEVVYKEARLAAAVCQIGCEINCLLNTCEKG